MTNITPHEYVVQSARDLIAEAEGDMYDLDEMNRWIGRALAVLQELTRDA